ncbi:MAG: HAD family hydrolase [Phycisphaerae bacterium]
MLRAILFDFDGVIAETEPLHFEAFAHTLPAFDLPLSREIYFARYVGLSDTEIVKRLSRDLNRNLTPHTLREVLDRKRAYYRKTIKAGIDLIPGVGDLIRRVSRQWPLAICSGSARSEIEIILTCADLRECFKTIVAAEDVQVSKPDPAGYLLAYANLKNTTPDLREADCLVLEDSRAGILAARAAGMRVIGIRKDYGDADLAPADRWIDSFEEVTDESLTGMM